MTASAKVVIVLIDGIGDVSVEDLGGLTPLQAAHTPYMDAIAGLNGLMDPVAPGLACGSDTAHLSLLGYNPITHYRGRGAFESMGAGIDMAPGDIAFKSNFATLDPATNIVLQRRADRRFEDLGPLLCNHLNGLVLPSFPQHTVRVKYATEHRCGVVVCGPGLSDCITGTDPLRDNLPLQVARPLDASAEAAHTAAVVNELSAVMHAMLVNHPVNTQRVAEGRAPANVVLLRGCGSRLAVPSFETLHGMRGCAVAPTKIIAGLAHSCGLAVLHAPGATGDYRTRFDAKAARVVAALSTEGFDFALLHVKAVDDTGHDRAPHLKLGYIEALDAMVGQLLRGLHEAGGRCVVVLAADHSTPVVFGDHSHEPVPVAVAEVAHVAECVGSEVLRGVRMGVIAHPEDGGVEGLRRAAARAAQARSGDVATVWDVVVRYDEVSAAGGALGRFPGSELMPLLRRVCGKHE